MKFHELHRRAREAARRFFQAETELLDLIQKIDACKGFREFGHASLFSYVVGELKLSESIALNLINVARKAVQVPVLKSEIEAGNLSVCKARKIVPVLNPQNHVEWIEKAKTLPTRALEKEIARVAPGEAVPERVRYVTESRLNLSLSLEEKTMELIKRVQDLECQKQGRAVTLEETFAAMSACYIEKNDPVEKAKRAAERAKLATGSSKHWVEMVDPSVDKTRLKHADVTVTCEMAERVGGGSGIEPATCAKSIGRERSTCRGVEVRREGFRRKRQRIPAVIEHEVYLRDNDQCTALDSNGKRCDHRRFLHVHHVRPVSLGGKNTLENLVTLCSAHHLIEHITVERLLTGYRTIPSGSPAYALDATIAKKAR